VLDDRNSKALQFSLIADTGLHQYLGRVNRTEREHHLNIRADFDKHASVLPGLLHLQAYRRDTVAFPSFGGILPIEGDVTMPEQPLKRALNKLRCPQTVHVQDKIAALSRFERNTVIPEFPVASSRFAENIAIGLGQLIQEVLMHEFSPWRELGRRVAASGKWKFRVVHGDAAGALRRGVQSCRRSFVITSMMSPIAAGTSTMAHQPAVPRRMSSNGRSIRSSALTGLSS
jgi:hypothetical protein